MNMMFNRKQMMMILMFFFLISFYIFRKWKRQSLIFVTWKKHPRWKLMPLKLYKFKWIHQKLFPLATSRLACHRHIIACLPAFIMSFSIFFLSFISTLAVVFALTLSYHPSFKYIPPFFYPFIFHFCGIPPVYRKKKK